MSVIRSEVAPVVKTVWRVVSWLVAAALVAVGVTFWVGALPTQWFSIFNPACQSGPWVWLCELTGGPQTPLTELAMLVVMLGALTGAVAFYGIGMALTVRASMEVLDGLTGNCSGPWETLALIAFGLAWPAVWTVAVVVGVAALAVSALWLLAVGVGDGCDGVVSWVRDALVRDSIQLPRPTAHPEVVQSEAPATTGGPVSA